MHEHWIFDALEQITRAEDLRLCRCGTRAHLEILQMKAVACARLALEPIAAAIARTPEIDDRADAHARELADLMGRRLRRPPCTVSELVAVLVGEPKHAVIDEQHVGIVDDGT